MSFMELIGIDRVVLDLRVPNKKQALNEIAKRAGTCLKIPASEILQAVTAREQLGSTGLGRGFALPHVRIDALQAPIGFLVRLARAIDYEAIDGRPVDVLFLLLMPADQDSRNVATLAAVSRAIRHPGTLDAIRAAGSPSALVACLEDSVENS